MSIQFCQIPNRGYPARAHPLRSLLCGVIAGIVSIPGGGVAGSYEYRDGRLMSRLHAQEAEAALALDDLDIEELLPLFAATLN